MRRRYVPHVREGHVNVPATVYRSGQHLEDGVVFNSIRAPERRVSNYFNFI